MRIKNTFIILSVFLSLSLSCLHADTLSYNPADDLVYQELKNSKQQGYTEAFNKIGNRVLAELNERMKKKPDSAWIYVQRGWLHISMGKQDEAIADFNKSNEIMPNSSAYMGLGMAYNNKGDTDAANEAYAKAMQTKAARFPSQMEPNVIDTNGQL